MSGQARSQARPVAARAHRLQVGAPHDLHLCRKTFLATLLPMNGPPHDEQRKARSLNPTISDGIANGTTRAASQASESAWRVKKRSMEPIANSVIAHMTARNPSRL